ncbi:MAG: amidohydrolase family protein, partial [Flavobacteriaceae bacterium]|nr:amidohydrolase family protein [Flavobacteriaceae bacterium]
KAIEYGLSYEKAIAAFTTVPASMLNTPGIGTLTTGNWANFLITNGPLFTKDTKIYEHWVQGEPHRFSDYDAVDLNGSYTLTFNGKTYKLNIKGSTEKASAQVLKDSLKLSTKFTRKGDWVNLQFTDEDQVYRLSHRISDPKADWIGNLSGPKAISYRYQIKQQAATDETSDKEIEKENKAPEVLPISYPNKAYGFTKRPISEKILFKNATVWTGEKEGVLTNTDVLLQDGKIAAIGKNLSASGARVIDATGKHLTAGIIDEHSHLALSSINESGHNSSAEVITADVINPDDIGIYRALAGGVTTAQLLHGSANPIGGRSAIVKFKWGETAEAMKFPDMPKFIKFALGENVKQSNWGSTETIRFPQSRMGVEQVYEDYFSRAKAYAAAKKSKKPYRYDEEMEVIAEIIAGERFISCHSYVQSEINMLMKVAERYGFTVNTFTHILEGYKVADKMREHGVKGASTFSDWWAYKFEVNDAIPYNAAIMHKEGLNVSINSDDSEMIRRLNQEAGKVVKYGGVSEHDAWKMVTINPAKMLHIDKRVGSIKKGKDADVVLWSSNPLSVYALAEMTFIEGAIYFDKKRDEQLRRELAAERSKLIELMLSEKANGAATQSPRSRPNIHVHCDTEDLEAIENAINH